jgi:hypothetical protein
MITEGEPRCIVRTGGPSRGFHRYAQEDSFDECYRAVVQD